MVTVGGVAGPVHGVVRTRWRAAMAASA